MEMILNGNKDSPPELHEDVLQVVIIGERKCGKTSFIRAFYDHHYPRDIYSDNGVRVYPCEYMLSNRLMRRIALLEIPGDPDFFKELRTPHYENADVIIFMYGLDDLSSLDFLIQKWIPEASDIINSHGIYVIVVGTKNDLWNAQQLIYQLSLPNIEILSPYFECSTYNLGEVNNIFNTIIQAFTDE